MNKKQQEQFWREMQNPKPTWEEFRKLIRRSDGDPDEAIARWDEQRFAKKK